MTGSSPLTRGKQEHLLSLQVSWGLIPAHAGKTSGVLMPRCVLAAHPRSRGENATGVRRISATHGSSPLTRGKPYDVDGFDVIPGLIPAHAGKTRELMRRTPLAGAHPRSRGENC